MAHGSMQIFYQDGSITAHVSRAAHELDELESKLRGVRSKLGGIPERSRSGDNLSRASAFLRKKVNEYEEKERALQVLAQESNRLMSNVNAAERRLAGRIRMQSKHFANVTGIGAVRVGIIGTVVSTPEELSRLIACSVYGIILRNVSSFCDHPSEIANAMKEWLRNRFKSGAGYYGQSYRKTQYTHQNYPPFSTGRIDHGKSGGQSGSAREHGGGRSFDQAERSAAARSQIEKMLENAPPPSSFDAMQKGKIMELSPLYKNIQKGMAMLSGDYSEAFANSYSEIMYLFNSFYQAYTPEGYVPLTIESLLQQLISGGMDMLSDGKNELGAVLNALGLVDELLKLGIMDIPAVGIAGNVAPVIIEFLRENLQSINQMMLLESMDKNAVLARAEAYMRSTDPHMIAVGYAMKTLMNSSRAGRAAILMGRTSLSVTDDMLEAGVNVVVETALNAAVPGVGTVAMTTVGLAGYGVDKVTGLGDLPSASNNLIYSVDSTQKLYRVYQKDYEAYQKNPSDANLKKAVDSYASYEHAIADMKQAEADFYNMTNRSFAGGVVNFMSGSMGPDTIHEGAAQDYRSNAEKADRLLKQYQKYRS